MNLKEEIGGIIYDADIYKKGVTTGQLNVIVDDIMKEIEKRIDKMIKEQREELYKNNDIEIITLQKVKEVFK